MEKTCLHRLFGDCKNCKEDYEAISPTHPANNYSCRSYYEIHFGSFEVVEDKNQRTGLKDCVTSLKENSGKGSL